MTTKQFRRVARVKGPPPPSGEIHLEAPPDITRPLPGNVLVALLPGVMIAASVGFVVLSGFNATSLMMGGMMAASTAGMMFGSGPRGKSAAAADEERKDYLRYLAQVRKRARAAAAQQRAALQWSHPDPEALVSVALSPRLWERRTADEDFGQLRLGRGRQRLATRLLPPQTGPVEELEPVSAVALRRLVRSHAVVADLPIALQVRSFPAISIDGPGVAARALARSLLLQAAVLHAPDTMIIAVAASGPARARWEWVKWLPHNQHPSLSDAVGPVRMVGSSLAEVERWLHEEFSTRPRFSRTTAAALDRAQVLVVIDDGVVTGQEAVLLQEGLAGVCLLDLSGSLGVLPARRGLRLEVRGDRVGARAGARTEWLGVADGVGTHTAETTARPMARYRVGVGGPATDEQPLSSSMGLPELLGVGDAGDLDVGVAWRPRTIHDRLRIPIGLGADGRPVDLDIKEAAQEGMGPHGLVIGATGSGKSEVLRTLVAGLAMTHSSAALNFVLVDFKGGATFAGLEDLPHTAAVITNLSDDLSMVDRMRDALAGEMNRRQELLRSAGNFASVKDYERARENGAALDPLPALLIVCDEFTELLTQKPDFAELFVMIGRLGRSLSMHLMLASQRLEEGKLRGLDSHLSYRIGLKTFSPAESRAVLGVADAYELPSIPGSGYLKFDTTSMVRFKAAYVSGPYRRGAAPVAGKLRLDRRPRPFTAAEVPIPVEPETGQSAAAGAEPVPDPTPEFGGGDGLGKEKSVLDVVVDRLRGQGPPAHEVWLPPLESSPTLDQLLPPLEPGPRGLQPAGWSERPALTLPLALVDRPYEQRRDLMWVDLSGSGGHVALVGGPQSGKSSMVRTLLSTLALTHTPRQVQAYVIDLGGGSLTSLSGLPHIGAVASRGEPDVVRRILAEVATVIREREVLFRERGYDSVAAFRRARVAAPTSFTELNGPDAYGDVFLVIDGWGAFRSEFEDIEGQVTVLAQQGLGYGVHVVLATTRWAEFRPALKDLLGTRIELRLGDPSDSEIDRRVAQGVPVAFPGRGLTTDKLHFLAALPRIDGISDSASVAAGTAEMVEQVAHAWTGPKAPRVRMLPDTLPYAELPPPPANRPRSVALGLSEAELAPVFLDFDADPHFLVFGDAECGKTSLLRTLIRGIITSRGDREGRIMLVDYRRTLLGAVPESYLAGYAPSSTALAPFVDNVVALLRGRLPGPDVTPEQLRNRSWWTGPELFVMVDDYDLMATPTGNPLAPLAEFLPQAKDVGLHLILARRAGGAARAQFETVLQRCKELSVPGLVMSGSRDEGALIGSVRPTTQPAGRGILTGRRWGTQLVQVATLPADAQD